MNECMDEWMDDDIEMDSYLRHVELPVQSLLQLVQGGGDLLQQSVQTSALLNQHYEVWPVRIQQPLV